MIDTPPEKTLYDWLDYLDQLHPKEIDMGLERVARMRDALELNPEFPIIIVGGTNGKGSVCAMLESIVHCAGYQVGCYTSPHLLRYNERIRINQHEVTDEALCKAFSLVESARVEANVTLTYFEFGTLAAMLLFIQAKVDVAVLEVGLGGRLDAVNVFDADCAVLTSIGLDHMDYLGSTREAIGHEKIGIFRSGRPAICGESDIPEHLYPLMAATGADLYYFSKDFHYSADARQWRYTGIQERTHNLPLPALRGEFQLQNASVAFAAIEALQDHLPVSMNAIRQGLVETTLPGRFQIISAHPTVILDVAHNPDAARKLAANLEKMPIRGRSFAVIAMLKDKDIVGTVQELKNNINYWLVAALNTARGASCTEILDALKQAGVTDDRIIGTFSNVSEAYASARERVSDNDRICVFGSFYTIGPVLEMHRISIL